MEMADAVVINKADGDYLKQARHAKTEFMRALHLFPPKENGWSPKAEICSALHNKGIDTTWNIIEDYIQFTSENNSFQKNRKQQNAFWLRHTINEELKTQFYRRPEVQKALKKQLKALEDNEISPFEAAELILRLAQS